MAEASSGGSTKIPCRIHDSEFYRFFCKDCNEFVCLSCLDERHVDHSFCRLESAAKIAWEFLSSKVTDVQGMVNRLDEKMAAFENCQTVISDQICQHADEMKLQIENSKEQLLAVVKDSIKNSIYSANQTKSIFYNILINVCKLKENEDGVEGKLSEIVNLSRNFKQCFEDFNKIISKNEPKFQPSLFCQVGTFDFIDKNEDDVSSKTNVSTETFDDDELEGDWYDAEDWGADDVIDNSSDAMENGDFECSSITLAEDIELVTKIIPLSEQDAWIVAHRKLRKIWNNKLSDKIYVNNIDDIAVLENGVVLLLTRDDKTLRKMLPNERIVTFAIMEQQKLLPYCFCTNSDKTKIFILMQTIQLTNESYAYGYRNIILETNVEGVQSSLWSHYWHNNSIHPSNVISKGDFLYVIYSYTQRSSISKLKPQNNFRKSVNEFEGAIGLNPTPNFKSYGICYDKRLMVSDFNNHCVYTLNDDLKYEKCVVGAIDGLEHPAAIACIDGILWVADGNKILRFKI